MYVLGTKWILLPSRLGTNLHKNSNCMIWGTDGHHTIGVWEMSDGW